MAQIHSWANGSPYQFNRAKRAKQRGENEEVPVTAMFFSNVKDKCKVVIADRKTGQTLDLPDDGVVFLFLNRDAAETLRDDLLDPSDFPDIVA